MTTENQKQSNLPIDLNNVTLDNVPELLDKVKKEISKLAPKSSTKEIFKKDLGAGFGSLEKLKKESSLIYAYSSITERKRLYLEAKRELETKLSITISEPFLIAGHTEEEIKTAIAERFMEVKNEIALKKFTEMEKFLNDHVSKEMKFKEGFQKILNK